MPTHLGEGSVYSVVSPAIPKVVGSSIHILRDLLRMPKPFDPRPGATKYGTIIQVRMGRVLGANMPLTEKGGTTALQNFE